MAIVYIKSKKDPIMGCGTERITTTISPVRALGDSNRACFRPGSCLSEKATNEAFRLPRSTFCVGRRNVPGSSWSTGCG